VVGNGCNESDPNDLTSYCLGVPNKEFRLAVARPFLAGKINVGVNMMIAAATRGRPRRTSPLDYKAGYVGPLPVPENPIAEVVGVRIPSYASVKLHLQVWPLSGLRLSSPVSGS
jgi:hypothetical protein